MEWKISDMMEHEEKNTEQRISDPFSWDGHETEAMLACESGNGTAKELVAVVRVRAEGRPEAFYRVKEAGQKNADFESWLEAVDYYNCIEEEKRPEAPDTGIAKVEITDEDWKTAIAQHKQPIPAGAKVKITGKLQNLYGDFLTVEYNGTRYTVDPRKIKMQGDKMINKEAAAEFANKNCTKSNCFMCKEGDKYETYRHCPFLPLKLIARERKVTPEDVPDTMGE